MIDGVDIVCILETIDHVIMRKHCTLKQKNNRKHMDTPHLILTSEVWWVFYKYFEEFNSYMSL